MAIRLVDAIDFDFDKFGRKGQEMALCSLAFDKAAIQYLDTHPSATVVALAEGLQTSHWRLENASPRPQFRWLTIDLPPVMELRQRLLPSSPRIRNLAQSALDYTWMDEVDTSDGVFITGLFTYSYDRLPYAATKAAIVQISEGLALYLRPKNIGVTLLCPGPVLTHIADNIPAFGAGTALRTPGDHYDLLMPEPVGELVVEAILANRFFVPTHPGWPKN